MDADLDKLIRAYQRLRALKENLPENSTVQESWVEDYHEVLQRVNELGRDVSEFRVPDDQIRPFRLGGSGTYSYVGPRDRNPPPTRMSYSYSKERYVDRNFLMSKIDAVLGYLMFITTKPDEPQKQIGFRKPTQS